MRRDYMISSSIAGTDLQITAEGQPEQHYDLHSASDDGLISEAEAIINREFYRLEPFPGFHWQRMNPDGWRTTDHDYRG